MPRRTVCVQKPSRLYMQNRSLVIQQGETRTPIPIEDIWTLIIESRAAEMTTALASELCEKGVVTIVCNDKHVPNGYLMPLAPHSRHAEVVERQLAMSKPLKKRLWQRIVISKIANQAEALERIGASGKKLRRMAQEVQSGDATNRESVAAAAYFKSMFPRGGRHASMYSAALDYGYTVLRAGVVRAVVSGGWLGSRGIHHANAYNQFNLADDLIEPYRPLVDLITVENEIVGNLTPEKKRELIALFEYRVCLGEEDYLVQTAIERTVESLKLAMEKSDPNCLMLPSLI